MFIRLPITFCIGCLTSRASSSVTNDAVGAENTGDKDDAILAGLFEESLADDEIACMFEGQNRSSLSGLDVELTNALGMAVMGKPVRTK